MRDIVARLDPLFLIDDLCSLMALGFFLFSLYIFPHLFMSLNYSLPTFVLLAPNWLQEHYNLPNITYRLAIFLPFFLLSLVFFLFSKLLTIYLEAKYPDLDAVEVPIDPELAPKPNKVDITDLFGPWEIAMLVLMIGFLAAFAYYSQYLFQYFIWS